MKDLIEHKGKKYRVVKDSDIEITGVCFECCFKGTDMCLTHHTRYGFPHCINEDCHFKLVEETNQK